MKIGYTKEQSAISKLAVLVVGLIILSGCAAVHQAHADLQRDHHHSDSAKASENNADSDLAQEWARDRLAKSPRHQEWVKVKYKPPEAVQNARSARLSFIQK